MSNLTSLVPPGHPLAPPPPQLLRGVTSYRGAGRAIRQPAASSRRPRLLLVQLPIIGDTVGPGASLEVSRWEIWPRRHWLAAPCVSLAFVAAAFKSVGIVHCIVVRGVFPGYSGLNPVSYLFKRYVYGLNRNTPDT